MVDFKKMLKKSVGHLGFLEVVSPFTPDEPPVLMEFLIDDSGSVPMVVQVPTESPIDPRTGRRANRGVMVATYATMVNLKRLIEGDE